MGGPRTTFQDPETGRWTRVCCECRETKDLERDFYKARREMLGKPGDWGYQCKGCKQKQLKALERRQRADPEKGPVLRAYYARLAREWRARNPERDRARRKAYEERLRKDSMRYTRRLENKRIEYRLRAERAGRTVRNLPARMGAEPSPNLPAPPLAELLDGMAQQYEGGVAALGEALGFSPRNLYGWREGQRPYVKFHVADRILTNAGVAWWEVWTEERYPDLHARLAA